MLMTDRSPAYGSGKRIATLTVGLCFMCQCHGLIQKNKTNRGRICHATLTATYEWPACFDPIALDGGLRKAGSQFHQIAF